MRAIAEARPILRSVSRAECLFLLGLFRLSLRVLGLSRSIGLAYRLSKRRRATSFSPTAATTLTDATTVYARRVDEMAAVFPGRARCLEQSLVLLMLLRREGLPAELRLGATALPFVAHAWVEMNGVPVNAEPERLAELARFPVLPV